MTRSISLVAVCCSNASVRSRLRCLQFFEQANVLDGDHCLVCKGRHQFDLPLSKWHDILSPNRERPNRCPLTKHGNGKDSACPIWRRPKFPKFNVWDVDGFSLQERAPGRSISTWPNWDPLERRHFFGSHIAIGDPMEELAIILANVTMLRPDEPDGICNDRVQYQAGAQWARMQ